MSWLAEFQSKKRSKMQVRYLYVSQETMLRWDQRTKIYFKSHLVCRNNCTYMKIPSIQYLASIGKKDQLVVIIFQSLRFLNSISTKYYQMYLYCSLQVRYSIFIKPCLFSYQFLPNFQEETLIFDTFLTPLLSLLSGMTSFHLHLQCSSQVHSIGKNTRPLICNSIFCLVYRKEWSTCCQQILIPALFQLKSNKMLWNKPSLFNTSSLPNYSFCFNFIDFQMEYNKSICVYDIMGDPSQRLWKVHSIMCQQ